VEETWESASVEGARVGFVHTTVYRVERAGTEVLHACAALELTFRRHQALLRLRMEQGTEETTDGEVLGVFMRQLHGGGRELVLTGTVEDGRLHVKVDNGRIERRIRWSSRVVGLYRLEHLFEERKPKPGDRWTLLRYEPTLNTVVRVQVAVREPEDVTLGGGRRRLLRVEMTPDPIEVPGRRVTLAPWVWWLDDRFVPLRRQLELDGLGVVVLTRGTRAQATAAPGGPARLADIGLKTLIPLDRTIPHPYATRAAVYRVTLRGPDSGSALVQDAHQDIRGLEGNTFELHVHPARPGPVEGEAAPAAAEFLAPCHYIDSDDPRVRELARRAVGAETDSWQKARRVERWVKQSMRPDNAAPLAPASQVARTLRGDCRLYALLTAALCRAEGIPSRTALGLVYVEKGGRPYLGFHMWTEVYVTGKWLGLDGTLGRGGVGATHIKIADHSWHDTQSLTPLLPVARVLGKVTFRVVETGPRAAGRGG
jgi:hypothetical protein